MTFQNLSWLIPALPLISFLSNGLIFRKIAPRLSGWLGSFLVFGSMCLSYALAYEYLSPSHSPSTIIPWSFEWLRFQENIIVRFGMLLDPLSAMMMTVVTTVSFLVHLFSIEYMKGEEGYGRYFTFLGLFTFCMLGLVIAPSLFQTYVFWELVGVSSFLLIGFYFTKPSAVAAAKKAFIVTRFADLGFLIGILMLAYFQVSHGSLPLDFTAINSSEFLAQAATSSFFSLALVLIYMGAAGKSAMFPLHIWLPDAMEGPTPVSALIHAATMVVAGVYLVARLFPAYSSAPIALEVVAWVGLITAALAALIACTQNDIKRVLAFSTLSQLGYMMFSLGIANVENSAGYTASLFHLYTHAFFKALLFLGAGSIIHAVHTNDIWEMGGLKSKMPITHLTFAIAVLAISGVWPFAGFFSKDEILGAALHGHRMFHFYGGLLVAFLTAFYMTRIYVLAFLGQSRSQASGHAHESGILALIPLIVLAIASCCAGFVPFAHWIHVGEHALHEGLDWSVAIPGSLAGIFGIFFALTVYANYSLKRFDKFSHFFGKTYQIVFRKFYFDEIYLWITKSIIFNKISAPIAWFDKKGVDGSVDRVGAATRASSSGLRTLQTGQVQTYGFWIVAAIATLFAIKILGGH